jgi:hypothetical protein
MKILKNQILEIVATLLLLSCSQDSNISEESYQLTKNRELDSHNQNATESDEDQAILTRYEDFDADVLVKVGEMQDDQISFVVNDEALIEQVNQSHFNEQGFFVEQVQILRHDSQFKLVFTGNNNYRITYYAVGKPVPEHDLLEIFKVGTTSCTTSACSSEQMGCVPEYPDNPSGQAGVGICTPCGNGGGCTKTVTR